VKGAVVKPIKVETVITTYVYFRDLIELLDKQLFIRKDTVAITQQL
jgi:hypothetical protein